MHALILVGFDGWVPGMMLRCLEHCGVKCVPFCARKTIRFFQEF
jgi:hypothetical protein